ncbi:hypothetical protein COS80_00335 [Candidatus Woesebacteria bacterium CG06_land_8_20_14_3_00_39_27]|uniref:Uncharacterized protein n=1 Tax=Candidatus Woesebacteria bacterium CG06_land_8_20_14_3_00_39_27 TaxID=1975057 RepID=A0A2M7AQP3_9BACT|nr:MAG: hypothetical protein COS80_00335 [Candidatus Woesebacteria bacterium CG06_land_8_20_14_3_00_39_27]
MERSVSKWSEINSSIQVDDDRKKWLRSYFKAQEALAAKDFSKARKIFTRLNKIEGYNDFEDNNQNLFMLIDIAVRGKTNRSLKIS